LGWVLASVTILSGVHNFLKAEDRRIEELQRRSERARRAVEWEGIAVQRFDAEAALYAAQAQAMQNAAPLSGLAWAQQNALQAQSQSYRNYQQSMGLLGSGPLNGLFGQGGLLR
jgi:hypothetical protein